MADNTPTSTESQAGRPTAYRNCFPRQARKLCKMGATNADLAEFFKVSIPTIKTWKKIHPAFLAAVKESKEELDNRVERSLFERAMGYSHPDVDIRTVSTGNGQGSEIVKTPITKHYPPDATSMIFWLKNRQPDRWRDVQRTELLVKGQIEINHLDRNTLAKLLLEEGVIDVQASQNPANGQLEASNQVIENKPDSV